MRRGKRGFTITELLLVIAILVILMGASVPGIVAIQGRLEQRKLDDYAREIFVAAQNQLSARSIAGTMGGVDALAQTDNENLSWLTDSGKVETLLEGDAMIILEPSAHCMLKYNPDSATVLEVYYSKEAMDEDDITSGMYSDEHGNNVNERKEKRIGYFRGDDAQGGKIAYMPTPLLSVDNGEELKVTVSVPSMAELGNGVSYKVTVTVQQLKLNGQPEAGKSFELLTETSTAFSFEKTLILDSLAKDSLGKGQHFSQLAGGKVTPGSNISVTATVSYVSGASRKLAYLASSASARTNSLFAGMDSSGTARIAKGRHLQNLDASVSGVSGVTAAVQTGIVNWGLDREGSTQSYYATNYPKAYSAANPLYFEPISNTQLVSYDGRNNEIQCLDVSLPISNQAANAGLFASVTTSGAELKNIALLCPSISNPSISNGNNVSTGALAGSLRGVTVTNCRCYGENGHVFGNSRYVGGLIGHAQNSTVTNCFAQLYWLESDCGKTVGGLMGSGSNCKVEYCYANIGLLGTNSGTGLDEWVSNYGLRSPGKTAGGSTYAPGNVGGLIGYGSGTLEINNCYACGYAGYGAIACGILGPGSNINKPITNSYSVLSYGQGVTAAYGIADNNGLYDNTTGYWIGGRGLSGTISGNNGYSAAAMLARPGNWISAGISYPYGGSLRRTSAVYPYPMINNLPHYGDWPPPEAVRTLSLVFTKFSSEEDAAYLRNTSGVDSIEQIPGNGHVVYNKKTLTAYAQLDTTAADKMPHAVVWQVKVNNAWRTLSGSTLSIDGRATVRRNSGGSYNGINTGGSVTVTAVNVNDFSNDPYPVEFRLRSILSSSDDDWNYFEVRVMPQLKIDPAAAIVTWSGSTTFRANRRIGDASFTSATWTITADSNSRDYVNNSGEISHNLSASLFSSTLYYISLDYGPYTASATMLRRPLIFSTTYCTCSNDGTDEENAYFIVEKGNERQFIFSWSGYRAAPSVTVREPSDPPDSIDLAMVSDNTVDEFDGSYAYSLEGAAYTDSTPASLTWQAYQNGSYNASAGCSIHVVGLEATTDNSAPLVMDRGYSEKSFGVRAHFPGNDVVAGERAISWSIDANEYIRLSPASTDMTTGTSSVHTEMLKPNTSGEDVHITVYCTFTVGTEYSYEQTFTVTIPSLTPPAVEPCEIGDIVFMGGLTSDSTQADWIAPAVSGWDCQLIAGKSIFIKSSDAYVRSGTDAASFSYYDMVLSESSDDIEIHYVDGTDHIRYFRIDAVASPASDTASATVTVGPWTGTLSFSIVQPSLTAGAYTLGENGEHVALTADADGFYECTAGTDMYLELVGVPDLSGLAVAGLAEGQLTATVPNLNYATGTYDLCLSAAALTAQTDITLTVTSLRYPAGITVKVRIVPVPAPQPAPSEAPVYQAPSPSPTAAVSPSPAPGTP